MRRREFIAGLGGAAAWPVVVHAQQSKKIPVIEVLWPNPPSQFEFLRQGLTELGYVEGKNIRFEFRWAQGKLDQLPELAQDLVRIPVDLIVTLAPEATLAAQRATRTIPIVFVAMGDPLASGVVASLARPGRKSHRHHPNDFRDERQACGIAQRHLPGTFQLGRSLEPEQFVSPASA